MFPSMKNHLAVRGVHAYAVEQTYPLVLNNVPQAASGTDMTKTRNNVPWRLAIVTGASAGIGQEMARRLASLGTWCWLLATSTRS
jgi:hypothetical protein